MAFGGAVSLLELVVVALLPAAAPALPIPVKIEFEAPSGCSDSAAFYAGVRERTERVRLSLATERGVELRVRLAQSGPKVHGELRLIDEDGATDTREVEGTTCDEVVAALSLTAALALDPSARTAPEPALPEPRALAPRPPAARPPEPFRVEVGARLVAAEVVSPSTSLGGALSLRLTRPAGPSSGTSFGLDLVHLENDLFAAADDVAVSFTALALSACPFGWELGGAFELRPCAVLVGGRLAAMGRGVGAPDSAVRSWWSAGALARASAALGTDLAVELEVGATVPLLLRRFVIDEPPRQVGETPAISALLALGASYRF